MKLGRQGSARSGLIGMSMARRRQRSRKSMAAQHAMRTRIALPEAFGHMDPWRSPANIMIAPKSIGPTASGGSGTEHSFAAC